MTWRTPSWWFSPSDWRADLLAPLGDFYQAVTAHRLRQLSTATKISVPVICVGNLVAGGSGKTPVLKSLAAMIAAKGHQVHAVTRGYGGRLTGPHRVDPDYDIAADTGDEALELSLFMPCWVAKNRLQGALAAQQAGAKIILLDDGLQNPSLHKDLSFVVVDNARGFGNGLGIPAGPLREKPDLAWPRIGAMIVTGQESIDQEMPFLKDIPQTLPVFRAKPKLTTEFLDRKYLAFAGIGNPEKFFSFLKSSGLSICKTIEFSDHHLYKKNEIAHLRNLSRHEGATLLTTRKDIMRLTRQDQQDIEVADIQLCFDKPEALISLLTPFLCIKA
jgi:tetraacyldisaccharide 4'-kinase